LLVVAVAVADGRQVAEALVGIEVVYLVKVLVVGQVQKAHFQYQHLPVHIQ
jgi:hypothetical protein